MLKAFSRRPAAADAANSQDRSELPADVQASIRGITVLVRGDDDSGRPRILVHWTGRTMGAWHHSEEATKARIRAEFPELNQQQAERAYRAVCGMVKAATESSMRPQDSARGSRWADWRPEWRLDQPL